METHVRQTASLIRALADKWLAKFRAADSGVAAVEFALVLPIMLVLYLGMVEVGQGVATDRKVTLLARTLADLTAQASSSYTFADMTTTFGAAASILSPYPTTSLEMTVTSVSINASSVVSVDWSCKQGGTSAYRRGNSITLPAGLIVPNTSLIMAEVRLPYNPLFGYVLTNSITLNEKVYMRPRNVTVVKDPGNTASTCPNPP